MAAFRRVEVWPRSLRAVHWVNALAVLALMPLGALILSGDWLGMTKAGKEAVVMAHGLFGMALAAGALARFVLLFAGPPAARWDDVVPHTRGQMRLLLATLRYYASGFRGRAPLYLTHNPLAGAFDTILFIALATQASSGLTMFLFQGAGHGHDEHDSGVSAAGAAAWPPEWLEGVHLAGAAVIALFVVTHLVALAAHEIFERRALVSSMISGRKFYTDEEIEELGPEIASKGARPEDGGRSGRIGPAGG